MRATFNIILRAFGLPGRIIAFEPSGKPLPAGSPLEFPSKDVDFVDLAGNKERRLSYLGTPVFTDLRLTDEEGDFIIDTVLIDISQTKNIVTTPVHGRSGPVIEYVSDGAFEISIRGALVDSNGYFPKDQVRRLYAFLLQPNALDVISEYLRVFDIYTIVIMRYRFFQVEGTENMQFFEIDAISDSPEEFLSEDDVAAQ